MIHIGQYDYKGLIKSYLAQDRPSASTANDRMSYKGINLYSYSSILVQMSETLPNTLYANKYLFKYSITTTKQFYKLQKIASHGWSIFVIDLDITFADNMQIYLEDIELLIKRYQRARTLKPQIKQELHELIRATQHFAELHKLDSTIPDHIMRQLFVNQLLI